jgi:hypothetical protein
MDEENWVMPEDSEPTEREKLFKETHKKAMERVARIDDMMQAVVKAQVTVEEALIEMLEAHGKDPAHYFFTSKKIKALRDMDTGVSRPLWDLLLQASYVRNELVHSLNEAKIKEEGDKTREAYLAVTPNERQKQSLGDVRGGAFSDNEQQDGAECQHVMDVVDNCCPAQCFHQNVGRALCSG